MGRVLLARLKIFRQLSNHYAYMSIRPVTCYFMFEMTRLLLLQVKEIEDEQIPIQRSIDKLNSHLPKVEQEIAKAQEKFNDAEASVKVTLDSSTYC